MNQDNLTNIPDNPLPSNNIIDNTPGNGLGHTSVTPPQVPQMPQRPQPTPSKDKE